MNSTLTTSPKSQGKQSDSPIKAAVAPHAGWYYSGAIAARAVAALALSGGNSSQGGPDTIAVIGGHLPHSMPPLAAMEDAAETPLGPMTIDRELRTALCGSFAKAGFPAAPDRYHDNTVEVLLPMVKYFFPQSQLLWLRYPAAPLSVEAGLLLAQCAASLGKQILVLGSTDLTHYGPNYGFTPHGVGAKALDWVCKVNDRRFIDAVEAGDANAVLERAEQDNSACSAGAVLGVMGYSNCAGQLLQYGTSADIKDDDDAEVPDSFVGYGAFVWPEYR